MLRRILLSTLAIACVSTLAYSQGAIKYTGDRVANIDYSHGQLPSAMGVHNIQTMRANRAMPEAADGFGWNYNHAAMIAYWNDTFFMNYLSCPDGEHIPSSQTLLQTSKNGYDWSKPVVIFPPYRVLDGTTQPGHPQVAKDLDAVMHQRMGFYVSKKGNRLIATGFYGVCVNKKDGPNDGNGIGRVVREIYSDGSFGPIYFIRYNHGWNAMNTSYPLYDSSNDKGFVAACEEMLSDPLVTLQWVEEADKDNPIIPAKNTGKAFCYYTLPNGDIVGLWKSTLSGLSKDGGKTWTVGRSPGIYTGSAKMWGERTSDGRYAIVYNPSVFRWPMAVSVSEDGIEYKDLAVVHGDISPMRYTGNEKSYGPQYLRGILPGNGVVPDKNMWLAYSVNKEDIWTMRVTVPIMMSAVEQIDENISKYNDLSELTRWNVYSPVWAKVSIDKAPNGQNALRMSDKDRYDYAKVEHLFPEAKKFSVEYSIIAGQNNTGLMNIELQDDKSSAAIRVCFDPDGMVRIKRGAKYGDVVPYTAGEKIDIKIDVDSDDRTFVITANGKSVKQAFYAPVKSFSKIVFRTGETNKYPSPDNLAYEDYVLDKCGIPVDEANFYILSLKTSK